MSSMTNITAGLSSGASKAYGRVVPTVWEGRTYERRTLSGVATGCPSCLEQWKLQWSRQTMSDLPVRFCQPLRKSGIEFRGRSSDANCSPSTPSRWQRSPSGREGHRLRTCNLSVGVLLPPIFYSGSHVERHSRGRSLPVHLSPDGLHMYSRKSFLLTLAAIAITAPGMASASSLYHPSGGEIGYTTHPEHQQSTRSRRELLQAVEDARKDGTLALMSRGAPLPLKPTGPSMSREQIRQEFLSMTQAEREYRQEMYGAGS